jgi:hypothetical protein
MQYALIIAFGVAISMGAVVAGIWLAGGAEALRRNAAAFLWLVPLMVLVGVIVIASYSVGVAALLAATGALMLVGLLGRRGWLRDSGRGWARIAVWLAIVLQVALALALGAAFLLGRS